MHLQDRSQILLNVLHNHLSSIDYVHVVIQDPSFDHNFLLVTTLNLRADIPPSDRIYLRIYLLIILRLVEFQDILVVPASAVVKLVALLEIFPHVPAFLMNEFLNFH